MDNRRMAICQLQSVIDGNDPLKDSREADDNAPIIGCYKSAMRFMSMFPTDIQTPDVLHEYDGPVSLLWETSKHAGSCIIRFSPHDTFAVFADDNNKNILLMENALPVTECSVQKISSHIKNII